ncbi:unnamed protein product [Pleuronectes platessa]|uniref:Uncharacterized protein n=1 Tax=Pleuronectes platessa TaxID=8262 RepID=A0A9N7W126_PLEPL|nr:unnamed protein product [Pleuronectes platessa]
MNFEGRCPSEGDGIDLSRNSGSINKQPASGFKAEETHLYFSCRVHIWIPERDVALDRWKRRSINWLKPTIEQRLKDRFLQKWQSELRSMSSCDV